MNPQQPPNTATDRQWLKITFFCPPALLESASDLMGVLSGAGVEHSPDSPSGAFISGFFQLGGESCATTEAILTQVEKQMQELFSLYGLTPEQPQTALLADEDWATSWKQYFKPFEIVPGLIIKPSWEQFVPEAGQSVIELDPGMAFGTGQHASTRMALDLIRQSMEHAKAEQVLDVGTGTGILAMAAALFGAGLVVAIDNDPDAVTVARENAQNNHLSQQIEISATPVEQIQGTWGLVCANIVHDVLVALAPTLIGLTRPGGNLVLAGILAGNQEANIISVYNSLGCALLQRQHQDEWAALLLQRG